MLKTKQAILDKIKEYDKILLFRHFRPDGDAVGSTKGLQAIIKLNFPEKTVLLQNCDFSDYMAFLGPEDTLLPEEEYKDALGIVIDTGTAKRASNQNFKLCKEVIKIDHHIPLESYGDLEWVEENRSSACEMIADFYDTFKAELKINTQAATYIYAGMVTDSGRFRYREVDGETMRLAGLMLNQGINTDVLYANLYLKDFSNLKFEAYVQSKIKLTENGVAYIFVTKKMKKKFGLSNEDASAAVGYLDTIRDSLIWIAFIENDDAIRIRFRSRFVTVSELAEEYRGGGHACAAGGTVYSKKEMKQVLRDADALLKNYKENNEGLAMMKILITNDDGINAPGIRLLAQWAKKLGEVTVVAPKVEQSAMSHAIDFMHQQEIKKVDFIDGVTAYSMSSTPADCVRFGVLGLGEKFDLVLSGINYGVNVGQDIVYSGTVAAIFEAARMGVNGIAFSTFPHSQNEAAEYFDMVYDYIVSRNLFDETPIYNVNIPDKVKDIRITYQGSFYFSDGFIHDEGDMYHQYGEPIPDEFPDDLNRDTVAILNETISVTPLITTRTDMAVFEKLKKIFN